MLSLLYLIEKEMSIGILKKTIKFLNFMKIGEMN